MKTGLLERILVRRYGQPVTSMANGLLQECWNGDEEEYSSVLYVPMRWYGEFGTRFASLREIYGHAYGGFLIGDCLKVAVLVPRKIFGLWNINDLRAQPEVQHALVRDPAIDYFMDEYNVLFYGIKGGELYVFDAETDELDSLGPIESALEIRMDELVSSVEAVVGH